VHKGQPQARVRADDDLMPSDQPDTGGGFGMKAAAYPELLLGAQSGRAGPGRSGGGCPTGPEAMLSDQWRATILTSLAEILALTETQDHRYRVSTKDVNLGAI